LLFNAIISLDEIVVEYKFIDFFPIISILIIVM
ncbi:cyclic AMP-responsive element-binding protein 3-like protein 4, partial [Trichonephila inaurata madagascariensis]